MSGGKTWLGGDKGCSHETCNELGNGLQTCAKCGAVSERDEPSALLQDVTDEAIEIREAMDAMGWEYQGGGPYPFTPRLRFMRNGQTLVVDLNRDNLDAAIRMNLQAQGVRKDG